MLVQRSSNNVWNEFWCTTKGVLRSIGHLQRLISVALLIRPESVGKKSTTYLSHIAASITKGIWGYHQFEFSIKKDALGKESQMPKHFRTKAEAYWENSNSPFDRAVGSGICVALEGANCEGANFVGWERDMPRRQFFGAVFVGKSILLREGLARILRSANFRILASVSCADDLLPSKLQYTSSSCFSLSIPAMILTPQSNKSNSSGTAPGRAHRDRGRSLSARRAGFSISGRRQRLFRRRHDVRCVYQIHRIGDDG